tara:strand:+ start:128 stop:322 length:195 start_codon:yes stop_codon:yes gene_type:complete
MTDNINNKHKKILERYLIKSIGNSWLVCIKATTERGADAPILKTDNLNKAIDYAHYFNYAYNME